MIELDGSFGEGGGQIIRTALALSVLTQQPFHATRIRQGRKDAGLKMQHLHCIKALQKLTGAEVVGAELGSTELTFKPKPLKGKNLAVDIETAGSITLFLQAVLLPCCFADKPIKIEVFGGTDVAWSMPMDYFANVLVPHLNRWADIKVQLEKRGYYPKGNGRVVVRVKPRTSINDFDSPEQFIKKLREQGPLLDLTEQHNLIQVKGVSHASKNLEEKKVAERQSSAAKQELARLKCPTSTRVEYSETPSTGSGITLWAVFSKNKDDIDAGNPIIIGADALGEKGVPAEQVGKQAAQNLLESINSKAPVDKHMVDNLVPWMALFTPSTVRAQEITSHAMTNIYVVEKFLPVKFDVQQNLVRSSPC